MNSTHIDRRSRRLPNAIAAAAMLAASGAATAEPVSITLEYTCPFPLIGEQPITAEISSDIPSEAAVGEAIGPFQIQAITTVNETARTGLKLVGSATIEGTATSTNIISTVTGDQQITVPLAIPQSPIPDTSGAFTVPANGEAAAQTFTANQVGDGAINVGGLVLEMTARTADGNIAPDPIGQFTADCTQTAGQDTVLQTFRIVGGEPDPEPVISVAPEEVDFGNVQSGLTSEQSVAIGNDGGAALGINGISLSGANVDAFMQTNNCTTVAPGESCSVDLTYFAQGEGDQTATLTIASGDPENPSVDLPLTGTSYMQATPTISVEPAEVDFGTLQVGTSTDKTVAVSNTGAAALNINAITLGGANSGDFMQTNDCATVAPDASCRVTVTYTANAAATSTATLTVESDDADSPAVEVSLNGQGDDGSSGTVDFLLDLEGATHIKASDSDLPLTGSIDAVLELATGMYTADLNIEPTSGSFQVLKLFKRLKATAQVEFEPVEKTTGTLINNSLTAKSLLYVKVPKVTIKLFGFNLPIGGGSECRTIEPVTINMQTPEGETFAPLEGGNLAGTYALPPLEHCGGLTDILNLFLAGDGNTIDLALTPNL